MGGGLEPDSVSSRAQEHAAIGSAQGLVQRHTLSERVFRGEDEPGGPGVRGILLVLRDDVERLIRCRFVIHQLVLTSLRVRYQNSALGLLWTLLHPLMMLAVLSVVFSHVLRLGIERFPVFLLPGLVVWQFFTASITSATASLTQRQGLIRKVSVFLLLFPISDVAVAAVHTVVALAAMFVILMLFGAQPSWPLLALIPAMAVLCVFVIGAALAVTTLATFFRDVQHAIGVVLQAAYFASPVMYPPETLPERLRWVMDINPMRWIIELFRAPIYDHAWPSAHAWVFSGIAAAAAMLLGYSVYKRHEQEFIFRL